jgi:hypothetical protein
MLEHRHCDRYPRSAFVRLPCDCSACHAQLHSSSGRPTEAMIPNSSPKLFFHFYCQLPNLHEAAMNSVTGGRGRIRTSVARKERQIYSLLVLATHPPVRNLLLPTSIALNLLCRELLAANSNRVPGKHKKDSCQKTPARSFSLPGFARLIPAKLSGGAGGGN